MPEVNIADEQALRQYLLQKGIVMPEQHYGIEYCPGGVSGVVAFLKTDDKLMIIKQAREKLNVKDEWLADPKRMLAERDGNILFHKIAPESAPAVYFCDEENYIFVRAAAPEHCRMWKTDLLAGLLDYVVADKTILALVKVHNECAYSEEIKAMFRSKKIFYELRISPYFEFTAQKHPRLRAYIEPLGRELMEAEISLVHADYSPKNVLVDGRDICILDYEICHYGHPALDVGSYATHIVLKAVKCKQWAGAFFDMLECMMARYFDMMSYMDKAECEAMSLRILPVIMLARVDGKSPVEYLTDEPDKELVRAMAYALVERKASTFRDAAGLLLPMVREARHWADVTA